MISDHLGIAPSQVTLASRFLEDLDTDSLDALDLLMAANETFGVRIPPEKLPELITVQDMLNAIEQYY